MNISRYMKTVSVVIPTYGRATNLKRAIDSCLNQTYENVEVIVVDDNPPESEGRIETSSMINSCYLNNDRLTYICHEFNLNGAAARNTGIASSTSDYIAFLDDDDEFLPEKIYQQVEVIMACDAVAAYTRCYKYKNGLSFYETSYSSSCREQLKYDVYCQNIEINSSAILCRRNVLNDINGFDPKFKRNQDYEFLIRLLNQGNVLAIDKPLYIMHVDSQSNQLTPTMYKKTRQQFMKKFKLDIYRLNYIQKLNIWRFYHFDLGYYFFKNKMYVKALPHFLKSLPEPFLLIVVVKRFLRVYRFRRSNESQ